MPFIYEYIEKVEYFLALEDNDISSVLSAELYPQIVGNWDN
jgi:hypothetical protein